MPKQDLRVIVAHANLVDVLRQSIYYVEEDQEEYRQQMIRAAELKREHPLSTDDDEKALVIEDEVNRRIEIQVLSRACAHIQVSQLT